MAGPDERGRRSPPAGESGLSPLASAYQKAGPYLGASSSLVGSVLLFSLGGYWLDKKLGNKNPWLLIVGAIVGMIGGFASFFRVVLGMNQKEKGSRQ